MPETEPMLASETQTVTPAPENTGGWGTKLYETATVEGKQDEVFAATTAGASKEMAEGLKAASNDRGEVDYSTIDSHKKEEYARAMNPRVGEEPAQYNERMTQIFGTPNWLAGTIGVLGADGARDLAQRFGGRHANPLADALKERFEKEDAEQETAEDMGHAAADALGLREPVPAEETTSSIAPEEAGEQEAGERLLDRDEGLRKLASLQMAFLSDQVELIQQPDGNLVIRQKS